MSYLKPYVVTWPTLVDVKPVHLDKIIFYIRLGTFIDILTRQRHHSDSTTLEQDKLLGDNMTEYKHLSNDNGSKGLHTGISYRVY